MLRVTNHAETYLVQKASEPETDTVLWGNDPVLQALILDLP